jgi:ribosome-associated protein
MALDRPNPSSLPETPTSGLVIAPGVVLPAEAMEFMFSRSGGPGGQNVNKLATRVQLRVPISALATLMDGAALERLRHLAGSRWTEAGDLLLTSSASRSQHENRQQCLDKLQQLLRAAWHRPKVRRPTRPSRGAKLRRLESKKRRGAHKSARRRVDDGP